LVIGYWLLVIGYWLLVIGYWLLVIGYWFQASLVKILKKPYMTKFYIISNIY